MTRSGALGRNDRATLSFRACRGISYLRDFSATHLRCFGRNDRATLSFRACRGIPYLRDFSARYAWSKWQGVGRLVEMTILSFLALLPENKHKTYVDFRGQTKGKAIERKKGLAYKAGSFLLVYRANWKICEKKVKNHIGFAWRTGEVYNPIDTDWYNI